MSNPVYDMDRAAASASQSATLQQNDALHAMGRTFNWWGGSGVIYFAAFLWLGGRALKRTRVSLLGLRSAEAITVASAINGLAKGVAGRARPFVTPDEPGHWYLLHGWTDAHFQSMPSGHTAATVAFAAAVIVVSTRFAATTRRMVIAGSVLAALFVAVARIYTNQHWLSDVLAGALIGYVSGLLLASWHERNPRTRFDRVLLGAGAEQLP